MRIVIAGGHGKVALRLERLLAARGAAVAGLIRDPAQAADLRGVGAEPIACDLEAVAAAAVATHLAGADAVVFAAGAGPGSGIPRKDTVDRAAAGLLADAAQLAGVRRYVLISSMGAGAPPPPGTAGPAGPAGLASSLLAPGDEVFAAYLRAKRAAEDDLRARDLDWTVLRPGRLTDDPGRGTVRLAGSVPRGAVSRDDVAAVVAALLDEPGSAGRTFELVGGDTPVADAVAAAVAEKGTRKGTVKEDRQQPR
jgi:nucleoside-diphosphate-sugar epimerase